MLIRKLFEQSEKKESFFSHSSGIVLYFNNLELNIVLSKVEVEDYINIDDFNIDLFDIPDAEIVSITLILRERREDRNYAYSISKKLYSIHNSTIILFKKLLTIVPDIAKYYAIGEDSFEDYGFCENAIKSEYIGMVEINIALLSVNFDHFVNLIFDFQLIEQSPLYYKSSIADEKINNNFSPQFVNTNTKARRLGYLNIFVALIKEKGKLPESRAQTIFENYAISFNYQIDSAKNNKGVIKAAQGKSADPYFSLLKEFNLISSINKLIIPSKWLKSFLAIQDNVNSLDVNYFILSSKEKFFYLELLLKYDFLYFSLLLELIYVSEFTSYEEIIEQFQIKLIDRLQSFPRESQFSNRKSNERNKMLTRVQSWKNAPKYLEHVIMPRLNWMLDLELIELKDNKVSILETGKRLAIELFSWTDINGEHVQNSKDYLLQYYPHIYGVVYFNSIGNYPKDENLILSDIIDELEMSFLKLSTLAPNRVTASQALSYIKTNLFFNKSYSVSEKYLVRKISTELKHIYIYKYQSQYEDGYIQKLNTR